MKAWRYVFPLRCKACREKIETCKISEQGPLSHLHPLFKLSVPSPAHLTHPSSEGDTGLSLLQHIPSSPKSSVSGQTTRPHSCMTPAKLKIDFHLGCQPGRKKPAGPERGPCILPDILPVFPAPWSSPLPGPGLSFAAPFSARFSLARTFWFHFWASQGSCQLQNPGIYGVFNHCSQLPYFHPLEHNLFFFFPAEGNTLPCNDLLKMSDFIALPPLQGKSKILICFPQARLFLLHYTGTYPLPKPYTVHDVKESHRE